MTFGEKLREARLKKGLSQRELAKKAGLGLNTISNYEQGKTYPHNREMYSILANLLGVDADYLHNENDDFIAAASEKYGTKGKKQAEQLISEVSGLFAGGELADEDLDEMMKALQNAYWIAKEKNKKYAPKKHKKD